MNSIIKKLRSRKGITQKQIADHLGIRQSTISRIENGSVNINLNTILKIFLYLKASKTEINDYLDNISSSNCYNFLSMIIKDQALINYINKDPYFCVNQFKKSLIVNN